MKTNTQHRSLLVRVTIYRRSSNLVYHDSIINRCLSGCFTS